MSKYKNILIIFAILIVPVILYYNVKSNSAEKTISIKQMFAAKKPVVLDFSSPLCMECKELNKVLIPTEEKYKDKIIFRKISIDTINPEETQLMKKYNVNVVPTLVFLDKKGNIINRTEGRLTQTQLEGYLNKLTNE